MDTQETKIKVVAISGSPRPRSFTDRMLNLFLEGLGEKVEVHKFYPSRMNIKPCLACFTCWVKTPGKCAQHDDMEQVLPKMAEVDLIALASPLYVSGLTGPVKTFLDRLIPVLQYDMVTDREGRTRHPQRYPKPRKAVLISSCGFLEEDNFSPLVAHFDEICKNASWENGGSLLVPGAGAANTPRVFDEKYTLIRRAGAELAAGRIKPETLKGISRQVVDHQTYREISNASFQGGVLGMAKATFKAVQAIRKATH